MRASLAPTGLVIVMFAVALVFAAMPAQAQQNVSPMSHPNIISNSAQTDSENWSGYAVTAAAGSVTAAAGSWTVPTVACSSTNAYAAFWVGIDGYNSNTVEQTGTMAECQQGVASYYAWYEFYPNPSYEISSISASPGDTVSASVVYSGGSFTVSITDERTGASYTTSAVVNSAQRSSAEWITEAPSSGRILPLADFGTVYCGYDYTSVSSTDYATLGGNTGTISSFGASVQEITMVSSSGATEAQPSSISSDGTSFSVAWGSGSTSTTSTTTTASGTTTTTSTATSTSASSTSTSSTQTTSTLVLTVTTNEQSYSPGSTVEISVGVTTASGSAVPGASVTVTLTLPNGATATGTGTTNHAGTVTFLYRLPRSAPAGTYAISASASTAAYGSASGSGTFSVT